jgi:mono/diheme cytochrome c family protein
LDPPDVAGIQDKYEWRAIPLPPKPALSCQTPLTRIEGPGGLRERPTTTEVRGMKAILCLLGGAALAVVIAGLYLMSGAYDVAADSPHWTSTSRLLEYTRQRSIVKRAAAIEMPDLEDAGRIRRGAGNYDAMCAQCHLEPGVEQSDLSAGLNPVPPNLARRAVTRPAEAFWTVKHGIKMTGMPAWGAHMEDGAIWDIVAFLRTLPELTPGRYRELVEASGGHSHGAAPPKEATAKKGETHVHKDGSAHQH